MKTGARKNKLPHLAKKRHGDAIPNAPVAADSSRILAPRFPAVVEPSPDEGMTDSPSNLSIGLSLLAIGITIGLLTAMSQQVGTASTLIGLLITLIGGTLLPHQGSSEQTLDDRAPAFRAGGVICTGIAAGVAVVFLLRSYEVQYLIPQRRTEFVQFLKELTDNGLISGTTAITIPQKLVDGNSDLVIQNEPAPTQATTEHAAFTRQGLPTGLKLESLDAAIPALPEDQEVLLRMRELRGFLSYLQSSPKERATQIQRLTKSLEHAEAPTVKALIRELKE